MDRIQDESNETSCGRTAGSDDEVMLVPSLVDQSPENVTNGQLSVENNTVDGAGVCKDLLPEVTSGNQEPQEDCSHRSGEKPSGTDEEGDKPEAIQCDRPEDTETDNLVTEMEVDEPEKTTTGNNDPEEHEHSKVDQGLATENASTVEQSKPPENNASYDTCMSVADHSLVENEVQENAEEHEHSKVDQGAFTENESTVEQSKPLENNVSYDMSAADHSLVENQVQENAVENEMEVNEPDVSQADNSMSKEITDVQPGDLLDGDNRPSDILNGDFEHESQMCDNSATSASESEEENGFEVTEEIDDDYTVESDIAFVFEPVEITQEQEEAYGELLTASTDAPDPEVIESISAILSAIQDKEALILKQRELFVMEKQAKKSAARSKKLARIKSRNAPSTKPYKAFVFEPVQLTPELEKRYGDLLTITIQTPDEDVVDVISTVLSTIEDGELHEAKKAAMLKKAKEEQHVPPLTSSKVQLSPKITEKYGEILSVTPSVALESIPVLQSQSLNTVGFVHMTASSCGLPAKRKSMDMSPISSLSGFDVPRCPKCRKVLMLWKSVITHLVNLHGMEFNAAKELISVARNAPQNLPVDCLVCGITYFNRYKTKYHMIQKHGIADKEALKMLLEDSAYSENVCPKCDKPMCSAINLRRHLVFSHDLHCLDAVRCMKGADVKSRKLESPSENNNSPAVRQSSSSKSEDFDVKQFAAKKSQTCPVCDRICRDIYNHLRQVHGVDTEKATDLLGYETALSPRKLDTNVCPQCKKSFYDRSKVRRHLETVHKLTVDQICKLLPYKQRGAEPNTGFTCLKCPQNYQRFQTLCHHLRDGHGYQYIKARQMCNEQYPSVYSCMKCAKTYRLPKCLKNHIIHYHNYSQKEADRMCSSQSPIIDSPEFSTEDFEEEDTTSKLKKVIKTADDSKEAVFTCLICPRTYQWSQGLTRHLVEQHEWKKETARRSCNERYPSIYNCADCTKTYRFHDQLNNHVAIEHGRSQKDPASNHSEETVFVCKKCPKTYERFRSLIRHLTEKHGYKMNLSRRFCNEQYPEVYTCDDCTSIYRLSGQLKNHLIEGHSYSKKDADRICILRYTAANAKKANHDTKKQQCPKCKKCFSSVKEKYKHMENDHKTTGNKALNNAQKKVNGQCPKCGKTFEVNPNKLTRHLMQVHKFSKEKAVKFMAMRRKASEAVKSDNPKYIRESVESKGSSPARSFRGSARKHIGGHSTYDDDDDDDDNDDDDEGDEDEDYEVDDDDDDDEEDEDEVDDDDDHDDDLDDDDSCDDLPRMTLKRKYTGKRAIATSTDKKKIHQLSSKRKVEVSRKNPTCPDCNKRFLKIKILEVHYRKRHKQRRMPHVCRHCQKGYFTAPGLEMHTVQFHEDSDDDEITQESVSEEDDDHDDDDVDDDLSSEEDISARHIKKRSHACVKSTKTSFSMKTKPQKHIFRCMQCPMAFFDKSVFQKHKDEAHKVSSVVLEAKQNTDLLKSMTDAQRQKYEALLDEVAGSPTEQMEASMILLCPDCDKYFHKKADLENHRRREHEGNVPVVTDTAHSSSASSVSDEPAEPVIKQTTTKSGCNCPCCGKKYLNNSGLATHMRVTHPSYKASAGIGQKTSATSADRRGSHDSGPKITTKTSAEPSTQNTGSKVDEDSTSCFICEHSTQTISGLERHIRDKHGQDKLPYNCSICSKGFLNSQRVTGHSNWVHKTKITKTNAEPSTQNTGSKIDENSTSCFICEHKTQTIAGLELHIKDKHGQDKLPYRCGICSKSFLKPERVTGHAQMVHKTNVNVVQKQNSALKNEDSGSNDGPKSAKNVVGEVIKKGDKFGCPECDKTYQEIKSVETHVLAHHKDMVLPYQCQLCVNSYIVENRLGKHMLKYHMYTYPCKEPLRKVPESSSTKMSVSTESEESSERESNKTGKVPDKEMDRSHHLKVPTSANKFLSIRHGKIACPDCEKQFCRRLAAETHYRAHHNETNMPFQCKWCVRGYFEQASLDVHCTRSHKGATDSSSPSKNGSQKRKASTPLAHESQKKPKAQRKDLECPSCKRMFYTPSKMEDHFRAMHSHEPMPYRCMTCLLGYFDPRRLKLHYAHAHSMNLSLDDLQDVKYKSDTKIEVDKSDGEDSYSSEKESYTSVVAQSDKGPAKSTANGDDDADSYTSDQEELNQPIDTLRDDLITKILNQPSLLGGTSTSSHSNVAQNPPITPRQQSNSSAFVQQHPVPLGNVIVIRPMVTPAQTRQGAPIMIPYPSKQQVNQYAGNPYLNVQSQLHMPR